jgi:protoporphyrinogen IX oxidase
MPLMLTLHIVFLIIWSASLLYLPELFVHYALAEDVNGQKQSLLMQRRLYAHVMTPSALLTVVAGIWLIFERGFEGGWLPVKLTLVLFMVVFHTYCGKLMRELTQHRITYYRLLLFVPVLLIMGVVTLVVSKPF